MPNRIDSVLVAFAGHGVQYKGEDENYFCPMDAKLTDKTSLISLSEVYKDLEKSEAGRVSLSILEWRLGRSVL